MSVVSGRYWRSRPCMAQVSDYWDAHVDPDGQDRDRLNERDQYLADRQEELDWIGRLVPGWVVDVGCGPGWFLGALDPQWRKVGIDTSERAVETARELGLIAVHGDIQHANLPAGEFDLVIHYHVIEHVKDPLAEMYEICEALKPGGRLLLGTPDFDSPCAVRFGDNYRMFHDPTHRNLFTRESMAAMLDEYGFEIEQIRFPFPQRYSTTENFLRWNDTSKMSPAWPGNWVTYYCRAQ